MRGCFFLHKEAISKLLKLVKASSLRSDKGSVFGCYLVGSNCNSPVLQCCRHLPVTSLWMDNVRNFVKNLYFILIQICFSQLKYITQHVFFKLKKRFCLRSVDAAWSKVEFCAEYGVGVYLCTRPNRHRRKARDCPRCATAV